MFQFAKIITTLCIALCIMGCAHVYGEKGLIIDRADDYQSTGQVEAALAIPPNLTTAQLTDDYIIPPGEVAPQKKSDALIPPGSLADRTARGEKVILTESKQESPTVAKQLVTQRIQGNQPVLIVDQSPKAAWSMIGDALQKAEYKIVVNDPAITTYFILDTPATHGRVLKSTPIYQVHLRHTADNNSTEVYVTDNNGMKIDPEISNRIFENLNDAMHGKSKSPLTKFFAEII